MLQNSLHSQTVDSGAPRSKQRARRFLSAPQRAFIRQFRDAYRYAVRDVMSKLARPTIAWNAGSAERSSPTDTMALACFDLAESPLADAEIEQMFATMHAVVRAHRAHVVDARFRDVLLSETKVECLANPHQDVAKIDENDPTAVRHAVETSEMHERALRRVSIIGRQWLAKLMSQQKASA